MIKYFYIPIKLIYIAYLLISVSNVSSNVLIFTISSPLLFAMANCIFIISKNSNGKDRILLIFITLLYTVNIFLFLLLNKNIIYGNLVIIIIEVIVINKLNLNRGEKTTKTTILSIPLQSLFAAIAFSIYHTFVLTWIYIFFVAIMPIFSLLLSISEMALIKKDIPQTAYKNIVKKIIYYVLVMAWIIPYMYSCLFYKEGLSIKIDFMIYGLLLAIYPFSTMLITIHPKTNNIE